MSRRNRSAVTRVTHRPLDLIESPLFCLPKFTLIVISKAAPQFNADADLPLLKEAKAEYAQAAVVN